MTEGSSGSSSGSRRAGRRRVPRCPRARSRLLATDTGRMTAAELAEALQVSPAAVSGAVRYLTQTNLVERAREPGSARRLPLAMTPGTRRSTVASRCSSAGSARCGGRRAVGADTPAGAACGQRDFFAFLSRSCRHVGALRELSSTLIWHPEGGQRSREGRMTELERYLARRSPRTTSTGSSPAGRRCGGWHARGGRRGDGDDRGRGAAARRREQGRRSRPRPRPRRREGARRGRRWPRSRSRSPGRTATLHGGVGAPAGKVKGGVLVIHENRGLTDHIRNVAGRFAANGSVGAGARPALRGGRHGRAPGRGRVAGGALGDAAGALRRRHEGGADRDRQARRRASRSRRSASASAAA